MTDLEKIVVQHQILIEQNIKRITTLEDQMKGLVKIQELGDVVGKKVDEMIAFHSESLIDISKKVNEGLMIANEYERKQLRMMRTMDDFLNGRLEDDEG